MRANPQRPDHQLPGQAARLAPADRRPRPRHIGRIWFRPEIFSRHGLAVRPALGGHAHAARRRRGRLRPGRCRHGRPDAQQRFAQPLGRSGSRQSQRRKRHRSIAKTRRRHHPQPRPDQLAEVDRGLHGRRPDPFDLPRRRRVRLVAGQRPGRCDQRLPGRRSRRRCPHHRRPGRQQPGRQIRGRLVLAPGRRQNRAAERYGRPRRQRLGRRHRDRLGSDHRRRLQGNPSPRRRRRPDQCRVGRRDRAIYRRRHRHALAQPARRHVRGPGAPCRQQRQPRRRRPRYRHRPIRRRELWHRGFALDPVYRSARVQCRRRQHLRQRDSHGHDPRQRHRRNQHLDIDTQCHQRPDRLPNRRHLCSHGAGRRDRKRRFNNRRDEIPAADTAAHRSSRQSQSRQPRHFQRLHRPCLQARRNSAGHAHRRRHPRRLVRRAAGRY